MSGTNSNGGYVKFGMYTEVRDYRVPTRRVVVPRAAVAEHRDKPTVAMSGPSDGSQMGTGVGITLSADANDPDGIGGAGSVAKVGRARRLRARGRPTGDVRPAERWLVRFHARVTDPT